MSERRNTRDAQQAEADRAAKEEAELLSADFKSVMATAEGVRVLHWVLERAGVFQKAFTGSSETFYRVGRQDMGKEIFTVMAGADLKGANQVLLEGFRREARNKKRETR